MTADVVAVAPSAKLRVSSPPDVSSEMDIKLFKKMAVDGGISLISSSRSLARRTHARPGLGEPV
jgi:hypothetical protein